MEPIIINGINITKELIEEFRTGEQLEAVRARARQIEAAREQAALGPSKRHAAGRTLYRIDPHWYHYWGRREGYEIWKDPKEIERFARDTPEMRVEQERRPVVNGWRAGQTEKRQKEEAAETQKRGAAECGVKNGEIVNQFGRVVGG